MTDQKEDLSTQLVTAHELAAKLGIARETVYRLSREGRLPCIRVGRAVRYDVVAVLQALQPSNTAQGEVTK